MLKHFYLPWNPQKGRVGGWLVVVGLQVFSVSPSPIETNWVLEFFGTWSGLGLGAFGTKGFGTGLDNIGWYLLSHAPNK